MTIATPEEEVKIEEKVKNEEKNKVE